jgi:hypothetical protein
VCPVPQASDIGELDACAKLTTLRKLCGQDMIGPRGVRDQSIDLINFAISPPPASQSPDDADLSRQATSTRGSLRPIR